MKAELVLENLKRERTAFEKEIERLETALNKEWQDKDQEYLCSQQYNAMCLCVHIIDERIADIEYKLEKKKINFSSAKSHEFNHNMNEKLNLNKNIDDKICKEYSNTYENNEGIQDEESPINDMLEIINYLFGDGLYNEQ